MSKKGNTLRPMRPPFLFLFCVSLMLFPWPGIAGIPQELNRVTLVNETGASLSRLFWAPTYQGSRNWVWGPNVLSLKGTLRYGETLSFYIHYPDTCGLFDFLAFDDQGSGYRLSSFQICNREEGLVILEPLNRVQSRNLPVVEEITVEFINDGPTDIWFLFLSPRSFALWGFDVLTDGSVLGPGDRLSLGLPYTKESLGAQAYDLLAVDGNDQLFNNRYEFMPGEQTVLMLSDLITR